MYSANFRAYKEAVVRDLVDKKSRESTFDWLNNPKRAKIKKEFWGIAKGDMSISDRKTLRSWLKVEPETQDLAGIINKKDADDFRGLETFMCNTGSDARENNVEMVALLIGYQYRPFDNSRVHLYQQAAQVSTTQSEKSAVISPGDTPGIDKAGPYLSNESAPMVKSTAFKGWLAMSAIMIVGLLIVVFLKRKDCMYWRYDRYFAAPCDLPKLDTPLVSYDAARVAGFRRILRTDTLTGYARVHFWYARVGDHYEVFTAKGSHPVYANKTLKRVTDYVINYCHNRPYTE